MSILVTCGHEDSNVALAGAALKAAGLGDPLPFHDGRFTPPELVRNIYEAHRPRNGAGGYAQIAPSKLWQALAVDMVLANLDQKDWGWADSLSVSLLEFWRDFDPGFSFVLVYSAPETSLARLLARGPAERRTVAAAMQAWREYNEALLGFFMRNRDRAILVSAEAIAENPAELLAACRGRFGTDLKLTNEPLPSDPALPAAALWSASAAIEDLAEARSLFEELQSAANLAFGRPPRSGDLGERALEEYRMLRATIDDLEERNRALEDAIAGLQVQNVQADTAELESLRSRIAAGERENELLVLQLQQVQEELEHYFHKYSELHQESGRAGAAASAPAVLPARSASPDRRETTIDMRSVIDGSNWYNAERDGRWAGPGTVSTLQLQTLPAGRYRLEVEVVDAIRPEIVRGTRVRVNATPVDVRRQYAGPAVGTMNSLKRAYVTRYRGQEVYPLRLVGEFTMDGATRGPAMLELTFPATVSPAGSGGGDTRHLAMRVSQVRMVPL